MRHVAQKREPRITLKDYLTSNSLRKKAMSKCNGREESMEKNHASKLAHERQQRAQVGTKTMTKNELVEDIKVKLAQFILQDQHLVTIIKLLDQLIQKFTIETTEKAKQNQMMASMIKEYSVMEKSRYESPKQSTVIVGDRNLFKQSQMIQSLDQMEKEENESIHFTNHNHQESLKSRVDIPQVNLLMASRQKQKSFQQAQHQQQTSETIENHFIHMKQKGNQKISSPPLLEDLNPTIKRRRSYMIGNQSNLLQPERCLYPYDASEVKLQIPSSFWNNSFETSRLKGKYQEIHTQR